MVVELIELEFSVIAVVVASLLGDKVVDSVDGLRGFIDIFSVVVCELMGLLVVIAIVVASDGFFPLVASERYFMSRRNKIWLESPSDSLWRKE